MIISRKTDIKISSKNKKYYLEKGYNAVYGEKLTVNVNDLSSGSKAIVDVKCDVCGINKKLSYQKYIKNISKHNFYACSTKCSYEKNKLTNFKKYGVEHHSQSETIKEKLKNTVKEKYNVNNVFQLNEVKDKIKNKNLLNLNVEHPQQNKDVLEKSNNTNLKRYGVKRPSQSKKIQEKTKKTNLEKYGTVSPLQNVDILYKFKKTNLEKYGVDNPTKNKDIINKIKNKLFNDNIEYYKTKYDIEILSHDNFSNFKIKCNICNNIFDIEKTLLHNRIHTKTTICTICNPYKSLISDKENKLLEFIEENYNGEIIKNARNIISPYELDIYLPELNLAFEFNGLYWHSELYKDKKYHFDKTNKCIENNIQLVHIWEDDWNNNEDIIKSMVLNKLKKTPNKIYARKCELKEILDSKLVTKFLDDSHIQGHVGSKYKIGLYYENELVALMTFGVKRKFMNSSSVEGEYELLRYCNKKYTTVIGGASKLFKYFIKTYEPKEIITYADRSHSNGNLYETLGFKYEDLTNPNYYYIIDGKRKHRFGFRKDVLVKQGYDANKTEHEIMLERKIYRIFNAGNYKYSYKF